jgi:Zn-dependent protease
VCVLVHELAHALVAQTSGLTVKNITLFIFGGMASIEEDMQRPGVEFRVAIAGPIASFLLAVVAFLLAFRAEKRCEVCVRAPSVTGTHMRPYSLKT